MLFLICALGAYLLGSIPFGFLAGRLNGRDLRREGSGNIGATNALRVLGKGWGYSVFALDFLKGFAAVKAALLFAGDYGGIIAAVFVLLGHNFPVWLKFKGGKGISTSGGIILGLFPWPVFVISISVWGLSFLISRYVSIASLLGSTTLPTLMLIFVFNGWTTWPLTITSIVMWALAIWRHRGNIQRLLAGTEPRFERKKKLGPDAKAGETADAK